MSGSPSGGAADPVAPPPPAGPTPPASGPPASGPPVVPAPALPSWPPSAAPDSRRERPTEQAGAAASPAPASGVPASGTRAGGLYGAAATTAWQTATSGESGGRFPTGTSGRPDLRTTDLASTAYGTDGPGFATVALPAGNPIENSGSLTGHILAQGWADTPTPRSNTAKVVVALAASLGLLVVVGVLLVLFAGDAMDGLVGGLLNN